MKPCCALQFTQEHVCTHKQSKTECDPSRIFTLKRKKGFQMELGKRLGGVLLQYLSWKLYTQKSCSKMKEKVSKYLLLIGENVFELA